MNKPTKTLLLVVALAAAIPVWRCGLDKGITAYEWLWHHTNWGPEVTHVPRENYLGAFTSYYGQTGGT